MGNIIDSCKSTLKCCDSDDERGYKRTITENLSSDNSDNASVSESEQQEKKIEEAPKDIKDMKISTK